MRPPNVAYLLFLAPFSIARDVCPTQLNRDAFDDVRFGCGVRHVEDRAAANPGLSQYADLVALDLSRLNCAFCGGPANDTLSTLIDDLRERKAKECRKLVVYGVSFGPSYTARMAFAHERADDLHARHGECFFRFTSLPDMRMLASGKRPVRLRVLGDKAEEFEKIADDLEAKLGAPLRPYADNLNLMVPVDLKSLPHEKPRRNVKILKMLGHRIFPWAERILWVDAKLKVSLKMDPLDYFKKTIEASGACAAFMGLPHQEGTRLPDHKRRIDAAMAKRSVTDNPAALQAQLEFYTKEFGPDAGENAMVDTALIARDFTTERCQRFNAVLGCAWYDEIQCFSDRDQMSLPFVLNKVLGGPASAQESLMTRRPPVLMDAGGSPSVLIIPSYKRPGDKPMLYEGMTHWYVSDRAAIYGNRPGKLFWEDGEGDLG